MSDSTTQNPEGQPEAGQPESSGFQKRIDELTAARYEAEGRAKATAEAAEQRQSQLLAQLQQLQAQHVQPQQAADPFAELDPNLAKALQALTAQSNAKFEALQRQFAAQAQASQVQAVAAQTGVQDAAVVARAQQLIQGWTQAGHNFNATDAMYFAAGEAAIKATSAGPRDPLGRFVGAPVVGQAPRVQTAPPAKPGLPQNFEALSPRQQEDLLKKNGVDDIPF